MSLDKRERAYKPPAERLKRRFEISNSIGGTGDTSDESVNRYDYLIVFRNSERRQAVSINNESGENATWLGWFKYFGYVAEDPFRYTLTFQDVYKRINTCMEPDKELESGSPREKYIKSFWDRRAIGKKVVEENGQKVTKVTEMFFLAIAREIIIDTLTEKAGVHMRITGNTSQVYCRIRVPITILEGQADFEDYRLKFTGTIGVTRKFPFIRTSISTTHLNLHILIHITR